MPHSTLPTDLVTNMPANLPLLPIEIVQLLASNLDCQELFSLRLVCRDLYKKSLRNFAKLFDGVRTDLTAQSLQQLSNISESAHLAPHVKSVRFGVKKLSKGTLRLGLKWNRHSSGSLMDPLDGAAGMLRDLLRDKLVNCRSFRMDSYDETGIRSKDLWLTPSDVFSIMFHIVVNINLQVASFTIEAPFDGGSRLSSQRLLPVSLHCTDEHRMTPWKTLESPILCVWLTPDHYDWVLTLGHTPRVRHLSLRFKPGENHTFLRRLVALGPFRALKRLSFGAAFLSGSVLSRFLLQHCTTIHTLSLQYIRLQRDSDDKEGVISWDTVFESLVGKMHRLEKLTVDWLYEPNDRVESAYVVYPSLAADDRYSVVPGSEKARPDNGWVWADRRVIGTLEPPVQLTYQDYHGQRKPCSVVYEGKSMDDFLGVLVRAKETEDSIL